MFKYPRTFHLPESLGKSSDDRVQHDLSKLTGELIVTEKLDGSNVCVGSTGPFTRSGSRPTWVRIPWLDIPADMILCGEWTDRFTLFGVWESSALLPWDQIMEWAALLDLPVPSVLYRGDSLSTARSIRPLGEGFVLRVAGTVTDFPRECVKYVNAGFEPKDRRCS